MFPFIVIFLIYYLRGVVQCDVVFNECGKTISRYQFVLANPGYPHVYPTALNCEYILKGHDFCPTEFHFQLVDFNLPVSRNCANRLAIIGHESLCGISTGVRIYKTEKGENLHLRFTSNLLGTNSRTTFGFKIVVTRIPCEKRTNRLDKLPECCATSYNSRRFFIASPSFPNSQKYNHNCVYKIYRANPNICRLRIHAKYFNVPGYVEIDGRKLKGCQTELDIISQFDQFWGNSPKEIRYENAAHLSETTYNGFVLEVIQDECPTRYSPSFEPNATKTDNKVPQFYYYNDQLNRVRFPVEKNAETINKLIDYYFFRAPDNIDIDREERNYFETTDPQSLTPKTDNTSKCINFGFNDYQTLTNEVLWKKMGQCPTQREITPTPSDNCHDVKLTNGYLISPGYPFYYYPPNIRCCYRFHKLNNYCGILFTVLEFQLEASNNCDKDALILHDKYKYCGTYLQNKYFKFDLSSRVYEDIQFQTDNYYCNKGFKIYFEHVPCEPAPVTQRPPTIGESPCGGDLYSEVFDVTISNANNHCEYIVHKMNEVVCGIELLFIEMNLPCDEEYLLINNNKLCGGISGQTKWVTFDPNNLVTIAYRRRNDYRPVLTSIVLRGQQITADCDPFMLDVPVQRQLKHTDK